MVVSIDRALIGDTRTVILELLLQGFPDEAWKAELAHIEQRRAELEIVIASGEDEPALPALHPHMAETFADKTRQLAAALEHPNEESRAAADNRSATSSSRSSFRQAMNSYKWWGG